MMPSDRGVSGQVAVRLRLAFCVGQAADMHALAGRLAACVGQKTERELLLGRLASCQGQIPGCSRSPIVWQRARDSQTRWSRSLVA